MPRAQKWVFTDIVSGEVLTQDTAALPPQWGDVGGDVHGPKGLYIIAQRMITRVAAGLATYDQVTATPYDPTSQLDSGYTLPGALSVAAPAGSASSVAASGSHETIGGAV